MSIEICLELNKQIQGLNARVYTLERGLTALQMTAALTVTKLLEALAALTAKDFSAAQALAIINSCVPLMTLVNSIAGTIEEFLALSPEALFQAYINHALNNLLVQISDAVLGPVNAALDQAIADVAAAQAALDAAIISGLGIPAALAAARQAVAIATAEVNRVGSVLHALNDAALCKTNSMRFS